MADLIDRQAVKDAFHAYMARRFDKDRCADAGNCEVCEKRCLWHEVVASVPAVDAVEVVRCAQCIYSNSCEIEGMLLGDGIENPYCAGGERREENDDKTGT